MTGWKEWGIGEVVEAGDFQTYVQDQTVQNYATSAARGSALGTAVAEGMVSYLQDSNSVQVYDGSAWQAIAPISHNYIINGAFDFWQRGTSFTGASQFAADRWVTFSDSGGTVSQQTFSPGAAPVAGYEGQYFLRVDRTAGGALANAVQKIEDVRTLAGQTATISFWAKASTAQTVTIRPQQNFGSGGSGSVIVDSQTASVTTSWQRFTATMSFPSISGKTIGTGSHIYFELYWLTSAAMSVDIWGVQVEAGSIATPFKRNAPSLEGELAACERYYQTSLGTATTHALTTAQVVVAVSTAFTSGLQFRTQMRASPTVTIFSRNNTSGAASAVVDGADVAGTTTAININATKIWGLSNSGNNFTAGAGYDASWTASAEL